MKAISILVTALLIVTFSQAQDVNRIEYFFDTDPGFGNGIPLTFTPDSMVSVNFTADITGLSHGMHMLCLRAGNENNLWSMLAWIPLLPLIIPINLILFIWNITLITIRDSEQVNQFPSPHRKMFPPAL